LVAEGAGFTSTGFGALVGLPSLALALAVEGAAIASKTAAFNIRNAANYYAAETNPGKIGNELGLNRERRFAERIGGRLAKDANGKDLLFRSLENPDIAVRIDILGPNGELGLVGGPKKATNLSELTNRLTTLRKVAESRGLGYLAAFEEGTPEIVLEVARARLGRGNVYTFPK